MTSFVESMKARCYEGLDVLFRGVESAVFVDFPDYPNVGDSAIALGHLKYFKDRRISVRSVFAIGTLGLGAVREADVVVINGGGNVGGLYPVIDEHRHLVASHMKTDALLIQGPQSVSFVDGRIEGAFRERIMERKGTRIGVRDRASYSILGEGRAERLLVPDAAHLLGSLKAGRPVQGIAVLARTDRESLGGGDMPRYAQDWLKDDFRLRWASRVRWRSSYLGPLQGWANPSVSGWRRIAEMRLRRGLALLARGDVVVTDRLHGMLLALQLGRAVVFVDNNNGKLSRYVDTWFESGQADLVAAPDFAEAVSIARRLVGR